jgi:hypothetical protein
MSYASRISHTTTKRLSESMRLAVHRKPGLGDGITHEPGEPTNGKRLAVLGIDNRQVIARRLA